MKQKSSMSGYRALSSVCSNFSAVFLATFIVPALTFKIDFPNLSVLIFSLVGTAVFAFLSVVFAEKGKL
ncbi:hypothetical protein HY085_03040 [Candidatus Gottesmanbacteria bacterium]|nr:hypothetical protein [Candidatus Gottesmanbacteria bacterium]